MSAHPLDHPTPARPHRVYAALTNACNRDCPWCSTCSSTKGRTFMAPDALRAVLPPEGAFELQLEGGEPTIHPGFWDFVSSARSDPRCSRIVLCTNGVVLPRSPAGLDAWLGRLGAPLTLKLSFNHHLLERDPGLPALARELRAAMARAGGERLFVLNVRLRRGVAGDDAAVRAAAEEFSGCANVFFLQRYGYASEEDGWDAPHLAGFDFRLVNPDGKVFGPDLVGRSEAMRALA